MDFQFVSRHKNTVNYAIYGALFGGCFPVFSYFVLDYPNFLFGVICTAPLFLGVFASFAGYRQDMIQKEVHRQTLELRSAKERAESADLSKSQFLAMMSHEVRTPLNAILACTEMAMETDDNEESLQLLTTVQSSGDVLLKVINDILDFTKIELGKVELEQIPFSIEKSISDVTNLFTAKASDQNIQLNIEIDSQVPKSVLGDPVRFRQVLSNLLSNAIKFASTEVLARCEVMEDDQDCSKIKIDILDDGPGISEENLDRIFESFTQENLSTTREHGGTGLGLAICRGIVDSMNGKIEASNRPEVRGACFSLEASFNKCETQPEKTNSNSANAEDLHSISGLRILVAEDNTVNQMVVNKLLQKRGAVVTIVENGQLAVDILQSNEFDCVLMDQHMPLMDGMTATAEIRRFLPDLPIVALTASAFPEDRRRCLDAGMNDFLHKPIDAEKMTQVLSKLCS